MVSAHDSWPAAVETYRTNVGQHIVERAVTESMALPTVDVIAGGPPCQGFSSAGRRETNDQRNSLVRVFALLIARCRPRAFLFENVEGFLTTAAGRYVFDLLDPVIRAGYQVHLRKVNAANFGVPQHRKRVLAIGGLGFDPGFPPFTHRAFGAPGAELAAALQPPTPTLADALRGLPTPSAKAPSEPSDHVCQTLEDDDLERARLLRPGQSMRDLPEELWHPSFKRRANRRVMDGTPVEKRGGAPHGIRRLLLGAPAKAITGGSLRDFLHPHENRPLTIREAARIQTFPDWFRFCGSRADRIQLIGNSVPPTLGKALGEHLVQTLAAADSDPDAAGRLLTFVPTLSEGMSPALADVCTRVRARFAQSTCGEKLLWA